MKLTLTALCIFCASSVYAQNPLTTELKANYSQVKGFIIKGAEKVPEADYTFKATPQVRSIGEIVNHITGAQFNLCGSVKGEKKTVDLSKTDKASAVANLKASFEYCDAVYNSMTDQSGLEMGKMFGRDTTKFGILNGNVIHDNEMYGTMAVYLRLKGIVPPSSEGRGAM